MNESSLESDVDDPHDAFIAFELDENELDVEIVELDELNELISLGNSYEDVADKPSEDERLTVVVVEVTEWVDGHRDIPSVSKELHDDSDDVGEPAHVVLLEFWRLNECSR